ncbi:hypothetical protein L1987_67151 [Smallanthus sonchifolius]|uniref:Uncharacterized protein n=1 Tax=Smallanthus sonchifolius TaxID=185202 RepID=A0ACB9BZG2_9ASTR|nr:hypothetical protein L1987_67151 [Smallanthus sonchifolius]
MDEDETTRSPFWIQTTTNRRALSSLFFNSFVLIIFLLLFALISMLFIIPSLIHLSSNVFRPNLVKRSWDSINLVLVLVALLFGFLSRNISNDEKLNFENEAPIIMYDLQDQSVNSAIGLRRQRTSDVENPNLYNPPLQPPSPSQPPVNPVKQKTKRVYRNVAIDDGDRSSGSGTGKMLSLETESSEQKGGRDEKRRARSSEPRKILSPVIDPLPEQTSPPPDSPLTERKRNDDNATKDFFTSFCHKKKKKRQRDKSIDNLGALLHHSQPPAVKFQPPAPPPLPAPPRTAKFATQAAITRVAPFVTDKPRAPLMMMSFNGIEDSSSGGESPMKQIPPPLPPFKMPDWKFAVEGDFVRLQSTLSSRSASPDGDEAQSPSSDVDTAATALFCPSPDVDTKTDSFIAKFRAGLKLERMSKLGPGSGSGPTDN